MLAYRINFMGAYACGLVDIALINMSGVRFPVMVMFNSVLQGFVLRTVSTYPAVTGTQWNEKS